MKRDDCIKCHACCSTIGFPVLADFEDTATHDFYLVRGAINVRQLGDTRYMLVEFPWACPHLMDDGECRIYDIRPDICKRYDCSIHIPPVALEDKT
jgi:Fe-S-cluster containining protein